MITIIPCVSVIIPVYNTSKYLNKCLDSVIKQTLKNIEIIIINDDSPDTDDDVICKDYVSKDNRIVYIKHHHSSGPGGARNTGIKKSTAKHIIFVDSDDFIANDLVQVCYEEMIKNHRDVVLFNFYRIDENSSTLSKTSFDVNTTGDLVKNFLSGKNTINPSVWNKMWKKSLFTNNDIIFSLDVYYQDLIIMPQLLYHSKNITFLDHAFYFYLQRDGSITNSTSIKHIDDIFNAFTEISNFLESVGKLEHYIESLNERLWGMIRYHLETGLAEADSSKKNRVLSYLVAKLVKEKFSDASYYFPHRYYEDNYLESRDTKLF